MMIIDKLAAANRNRCLARAGLTFVFCIIFAMTLSCSKQQEDKTVAGQPAAQNSTSRENPTDQLRTIYKEFITENNPIRGKWTLDDISKKIESADRAKDRVDSVCSGSENQQDSDICVKFQEALQKHRERLDKINEVENRIAEGDKASEEHKKIDEKLAKEDKESVFKEYSKEKLAGSRSDYLSLKGNLTCAGGPVGVRADQCPYRALDQLTELK